MKARIKVLPALLLIATAGITGCTSTAGQVVTAPAGSAAGSAPAAKAASLGQTLNLKDVQASRTVAVTLVKVVDPDHGSDQFNVAKPGTRYVSIQLRILNTAKTTYSDDPQMEIKVADTAGQNYDVTFVTATAAGPQMDSGLNLAPGNTALGYLTFEVPTGVKLATVQYRLSAGLGQVGQWSVR